MRIPLMLAAAALLVPAASAMLAITPHFLQVEDPAVEVGQQVPIRIVPQDDGNATRYAGQQVLLNASEFDGAKRWAVGTVTLDAAGAATFTWTVPADADDENVFVNAYAGETLLGTVHLNVGDAEPLIMLMSGPAPEEEPVDGDDGASGNLDDGSGPDDADPEPERTDRDAPAPLLHLLALGLLVLVAVRRR